MEKQFLKTIKKHNLVSYGDSIIIGFSGGPDSLTLLKLLLDIKDEYGLHLYTAHLNHGFRGKEADEDQILAREISEKLGVKHFSKKVDCIKLARDKVLSTEDAGRKARYDFFAEISHSLEKEGKEAKGIKIAVGQNKNDQAETILFRVIRGSGTDGLGGIEYKSINQQGSTVIRPILDIWRKDIEEYCYQKKLVPIMDASNEKKIYTRNKLRLDLIPKIQDEYNESFLNNLITMGKLARNDSSYIWIEAKKIFDEALIDRQSDRVKLDLNVLRGHHKALWSRVIIEAFGILNIEEMVNYKYIDSIGSLFDIKEGLKVVQLSKGWECRVGYGQVELCKPIKDDNVKLNVRLIDKMQLGDEAFAAMDRNNKNMLMLDFDKILDKHRVGEEEILSNIIFRTRQPGDFIRMKGQLGRQKLKKVLIEMKIPKSDRDGINLVALREEILWIPQGLYRERITGQYRLESSTTRVLSLEISQ